ncbi:MAG: HAD-IG family 5'-nucleotidase [Acidimicrobiales bacterium]|nr:HAD-IG family 5'-nucleotidase [Acidimicrobiales bacterium]
MNGQHLAEAEGEPAPLHGPAGPGVAERPVGVRRVYCNRSLRLDHVRAVGFDMDYTLAIYHQRHMDELQARLTIERLVGRGYPEDLRAVPVPTDFAIRGLLVDVRRGNVLKMDRYRYVKRAYHGLHPLSRAERRELYESRRLRPGVDRYHWVDTLYSLADVAVYAGIIDHLERTGRRPDYRQLFADVRLCADEAHAGGAVNAVMERDLARYVVRDPALGTTLHRLRSAGKKLFLLTNSRPEQTEPMMAHLLDGSVPGYSSWRQFFDVIVTAARKPLFFTDRAPFTEPNDPGAPVTELRRGRVYRGGNMADFERMLGVSGTDVLYVGDHIYGDVLRANVESGWRTLMIIQEMADELHALARHEADILHADELDHLLRLTREERRATPAGNGAAGNGRMAGLANRAVELELERDRLEAAIDQSFHPYWGSLFKAGSELSSFGAQVEQYAWLYTERVSNLGGYPANHFFRSPRALMAHEL